jgi:predicted RNA binding protein YcfA (HicA-like mRNA interferase family)
MQGRLGPTMAKASVILEKVTTGRGRIQFRDFQKLLLKLGFHLDRTRGSHHIYLHPKVTRAFSVQCIGNEAKPFQVRQLRDMIAEFGLKLEDE